MSSSRSVSPINELLNHDHEHNTKTTTQQPDTQTSKLSLFTTSDKHAKHTKQIVKQGQRWLEKDWYAWEILGIGISGGILITMVAVLASYNNTPQPKWTHISLNSLISLLSTASKGCIVFAISEALGQLKWSWFQQKTRPVPDLGQFDTVSQGVFGAITLIWRLRARLVTIIILIFRSEVCG